MKKDPYEEAQNEFFAAVGGCLVGLFLSAIFVGSIVGLYFLLT